MSKRNSRKINKTNYGNDQSFNQIFNSINHEELQKLSEELNYDFFEMCDTEHNEASATTSYETSATIYNEASAKSANELTNKSFLNENEDSDIDSKVEFPKYFNTFRCQFCNESFPSADKYKHTDHHLRLFHTMLKKLYENYGDDQFMIEFLNLYERCQDAFNAANPRKKQTPSEPSTPQKSIKVVAPGYNTPKSSNTISTSFIEKNGIFQESKETEKELQQLLSNARYPTDFKINFYLLKKGLPYMCVSNQSVINKDSLYYCLAKGLKDELITPDSVKNTLLASLNLFSHRVDPDTLLEYEQLFEGFRCYYKKGITLYHWNNNVLSVLREEERKDIQLVMYHHDNSRNAIFLLLESTIA